MSFRKHKWRIGVALLTGGAAAYFGPNIVLGPKVAGDVAIRGLFLQTVVASGHVEAPYRVNIGSQITAVVASVPVIEGQSVKAGDTLIVLDDSELRAASLQAEGVVAQAEARMRQMKELTAPAAQESYKQLQASLTNAQQSFDRASKLAKEGYATRAALDESTRALDVARAQLRSAEFQVATTQVGGSDYVMVQTQLTQAKASFALAQSRLSYTIIKAPRDGILISRNVEKGNTVSPAGVLMILSPDGEMQLIVQIDEKNLGLIATGQAALGSADAYAKESFAAEVFYINPGIDLQRASVEVKLRVAKPPAYLRQDMTISVDIEVARRDNSVILDAGSIRDANTAKPWVMKVVDGRAQRQNIVVGLVSAGKATIASGVYPGELLIPASNATIRIGQRVRSRARNTALP